jgi:4-hydroxy-tetrahydrodipicolinate reductase
MTAPAIPPTRVALCGIGTVGMQVARLLLDHRRGVEIVGAASKDASQIGRPLHTVLGTANGDGRVVVDSLKGLLVDRPDVVVLATGSFLEDVADDVLACAAAGADVVSPCEELAYPFTRDPGLARQIDEAARAGGSTVLGTGVNPGFIFDALVAAATGVCWDVAAIRGRRVVDVFEFGENIHRRLGLGTTPEEFDEGHASGEIAGHVGFPESIQILCERLGVELDQPVQETFEPLVAASSAPTKYGDVAAGRVEGFIQRAIATADGREFVRLELLLHLRPGAAGYAMSDTFEIDGLNQIRVTLEPGMDSVRATAAELVNSLPGVIQAGPGLKTVKDLPPAAAWLGDIRSGLLR